MRCDETRGTTRTMIVRRHSTLTYLLDHACMHRAPPHGAPTFFLRPRRWRILRADGVRPRGMEAYVCVRELCLIPRRCNRQVRSQEGFVYVSKEEGLAGSKIEAGGLSEAFVRPYSRL